MSEKRKYAPLFETSKSSSGGGLPSDFDLTIKTAKTMHYQFPNSQYGANSVLYLGYTNEEGEEKEEYIGAGSDKTWNCDGNHFVPNGTKSEIDESTNMGLFIKALAESGFNSSSAVQNFDRDGWKVLEGQRFHQERLPKLDAKGNPKIRKYKDRQGVEREVTDTYFALTQWLGSENEPSGASGDSNQQPADLENQVAEAIKGLVASGPMDKSILLGKLAEKFPTQVTVIAPWFQTEEFITRQPGLTVSNGKVQAG